MKRNQINVRRMRKTKC